ncbi:type II toxin-antitoxin system VapC family toxin [Rhodovarius lipocyclicus]|uniref:type II toxin-antitoxin system VapC family toxin n=1 Tax=Rhodovarius lipocyclicus TaxID=268410 RepID=UPI001F1B575B|nr:type II toxin-antitoxin system VapC family toxin [Rhodovarius lipocyclicus]
MDSSIFIAVLRGEAGCEAYEALLVGPRPVVTSAATLVEAAIVAEGKGGEGAGADLDALIRDAEIDVIPFTAEHAALARDAWRRYGKGRHPAGLNLGDCFSYALAKSRNEPLLFKGEDFARTDVKAAI